MTHRTASVFAAIALLCAPPTTAAPWGAAPTLTAAFLYNIAKFAEWPLANDPSAPLALCVLNDTESETALARLATGGVIEGRTVTVHRATSRDEWRSCQLLYLSVEDAAEFDSVLAALQGTPVLTVGNGKRFVKRGGIVGLVFEDGRMKLVINPSAAERRGLRLSSKLLSLATLVHD